MFSSAQTLSGDSVEHLHHLHVKLVRVGVPAPELVLLDLELGLVLLESAGLHAVPSGDPPWAPWGATLSPSA